MPRLPGVEFIRKRPGGAWSIRFWLPSAGRQITRGTGEKDDRRAQEIGAQIHAETIRRGLPSQPRRTCSVELSTLAVGRRWLEEAEGWLDPKTISTYSVYLETHLVPAWPSLLEVNAESVRRYQGERLKHVQAQTVRHELSALRQLCKWAVDKELLAEAPVIPGIPMRVLGVPFKTRRRVAAIELSQQEVEAFLLALPEWSIKAGPVQARYIFQYETAMRTETMAQLSVPEDWAPGWSDLRIRGALLKQRKPVILPLTALAYGMLSLYAPKRGIIWGAVDLRWHTKSAARVALSPERATLFTPTHLRSAAITHWLDQGMALTAAQWLAGHARATTTNRYVRPSQRAAVSELRRLGLL